MICTNCKSQLMPTNRTLNTNMGAGPQPSLSKLVYSSLCLLTPFDDFKPIYEKPDYENIDK